MITVGSIMKRQVASVRPSTSVRDAFERMGEREVRHLPVVDDRNRVVGMVSQRDLLRALDMMRAVDGSRGDAHVEDVMKKEVLRVPMTLPAHEAASTMIERKIGALPVVDGEDHLVGILTETDYLELAREALLGVNPTTVRARG